MGSKWATQDMGALKATKFGHHCVECDGHFHCRGFLIRRSGGTARCVCVSVSGRRDNALSYVTLETLNPPRLPRAYLSSSLALFGQLRILYHCHLSRCRCFSFLWHFIHLLLLLPLLLLFLLLLLLLLLFLLLLLHLISQTMSHLYHHHCHSPHTLVLLITY